MSVDKDSVMSSVTSPGSIMTSSNGIMTSPSNSVMSGGLQNQGSQSSHGEYRVWKNQIMLLSGQVKIVGDKLIFQLLVWGTSAIK